MTLGLDDYLAKPFNRADLQDVITGPAGAPPAKEPPWPSPWRAPSLPDLTREDLARAPLCRFIPVTRAGVAPAVLPRHDHLPEYYLLAPGSWVLPPLRA
jgi:hypothetical protein